MGHLVNLGTTCDIIYGGWNSFEINIMKEFQITNGPLIVDNLVINKVYTYKM